MQGTGPGGGVGAGADGGGAVVMARGCTVETVEMWVWFVAVVAEGVVGSGPLGRTSMGCGGREVGSEEGADRGLELLFEFDYIGSSLRCQKELFFNGVRTGDPRYLAVVFC